MSDPIRVRNGLGELVPVESIQPDDFIRVTVEGDLRLWEKVRLRVTDVGVKTTIYFAEGGLVREYPPGYKVLKQVD